MRSFKQRGFFGLEGVALYAVVGLTIALALSWAGAGAAIWYLDGKVTRANEKATASAVQAGKEEQSRLGFQAAAVECGKATERRAEVANAEAARRRGELKDERARTAALQGEVDDLMTKQRKPGEDQCTAARRIFDDEIRRRHPGG